MELDNTRVFAQKASYYTKFRPSYARDFIDYLYSDLNFSDKSKVADIGAGTGIFTKLLLERESMVFAIEPNLEMRNVAELDLIRFGKLRLIDAQGESTKLANASVDFITVAQAFHWLDAELFKKECNRILRPGGSILIIYNRKRKEAKINQRQSALVKKYYPNHYDIINHWELREKPVMNFLGTNCDFVSYENNIVNNIQQFVGRVLSASFSKEDSSFISELEDIFHEFSCDGLVNVPNDTIAYIKKF